MKIILCFFFCSLLQKSVAQEVIYYDSFFKSISGEKTDYVRTFDILDTAVLVTQTQHDSVTLSGAVYGNSNVKEVNDLTQFVKNNGNPYSFKDFFIRMKGQFSFYSDQGKPSRMMISRNGKVFYSQVWTDAGEPLLIDGTGIQKYHEEKENEEVYEQYIDSVLVERYSIRHTQRDTIYDTYDKLAEPKEGYQSFIQDLVNIFKYPGFARLAGKEGIVYVQFIVDKTGKLTEFKPLTKQGFNLEKKAVQRLGQLPDWNPSVFQGKKIKMKFVLPIKFKLI